jgi:hypothetical protein
MSGHDLDFPAPKHPTAAPYLRHDPQVHVRLPWHLVARFQNECYRQGESMSEVVRGMIQAYVESVAESERAKA